MYDAGTAQEYIVCNEEDVELAPEHLSAVEGAALPLVGLTGWRALVTKTGENASRGRNILITGCVFSMLSFLAPSACYSVSPSSPSYGMSLHACSMAYFQPMPVTSKQSLKSVDSCMSQITARDMLQSTRMVRCLTDSRQDWWGCRFTSVAVCRRAWLQCMGHER